MADRNGSYAKMRASAAMGFFLLVSTTCAATPGAASETMQFSLLPPTLPEEIGGSAWDIYATGPTDPGAPNRLAALVKKHPQYTFMYFDSPGRRLAHVDRSAPRDPVEMDREALAGKERGSIPPLGTISCVCLNQATLIVPLQFTLTLLAFAGFQSGNGGLIGSRRGSHR
jgi:hypothetical protein